MLDICLAGTAGMVPLKNRWLTTCYIQNGSHAVLIDCGEGTQIALASAGCRLKLIDTILITHFHADHIAGIAGLLLTMGNQGRTEDVVVMGPPGLSEVLRSLLIIAAPPFRVLAIETDGTPESGGSEFQSSDLEIRAFPAKHVIPCLGYQLTLPRRGKFSPEKAKALGIPLNAWSLLQSGQDVLVAGRLVHPEEVVGAPRQGLKLVYSTDTRPVPEIAEAGRDSDLMILEGQYPNDDKLEKAKEYGHMTYEEAARLALAAHTKELWLTHFSQSIEDPNAEIENATRIFPNTKAGFDGMRARLRFTD